MLKTFLVMAVVSAVPQVFGQTGEKPVYTYIAEYTVPRANWSEFVSGVQKQSVPVLEKLVASGVLLEYGLTSSWLHTPDGATHAIWWTASNFAGIQRAMDEMIKAGPQPVIAGIKHRDRFVRSVVYRARTGRLKDAGFIDTNVWFLKSGKSEEWRALYDKYTRPVLEKLYEEGTILGYGVDQEQVHTEKSTARYGWTLYPNAEAVDKLEAAFAAARAKASPEERNKVMAAYREVTESDTHRDGMDSILNWAHK